MSMQRVCDPDATTHIDIPHVRMALELSQMLRQRVLGAMMPPPFDLSLGFFGRHIVVVVDTEACKPFEQKSLGQLRNLTLVVQHATYGPEQIQALFSLRDGIQPILLSATGPRNSNRN